MKFGLFLKTKLDIAGGQWNLDNTDGDFRIGTDAIGLRIGVAVGNGPGGGNVHIRAQGGTTNSLRFGSGNNDGILVVQGQNVSVNGDINITGEINRPATGLANMVPIAYVSVRIDGTIYGGSGNFTITRNSVGNYRISVNGETISLSSNSVIASGLGPTPKILTTGQIDNVAQVFCHDLNGARVNSPFASVIYKL